MIEVDIEAVNKQSGENNMQIIFLCEEEIRIYKRVLPVYRGLKSQRVILKSLVMSLGINDAIIVRL